MSRVPNPKFGYLHPSEIARLGLEDEYVRYLARSAADEKDRLRREGPDNAPRKEVKRDQNSRIP